jgi:hypothetical protein
MIDYFWDWLILFPFMGDFGFQNIDPESTPADMDLEDDDQIDCFLQQTGGMKN